MLKIKINPDKKLQFHVWLAACAMFLIMFIVFVADLMKTSTYITVMATVTNTSTEIPYYDSDSSSKHHYITYSYDYEGRSYTENKEVFLRILHKKGNNELIKINPGSPADIENTYNRVWIALGAIISFITAVLTTIPATEYLEERRKFLHD